MLRAVIFDFDGVITDSEILHFRAFNEILREFGFELTKQEYYGIYLGMTDVDCYKALIEEGRLEIDPGQISALVEKKNVFFERLARKEGQIIDGVRRFLSMLRENNVPMAICSGALLSEIEMILRQSDLRDHFGVIVAADHISQGKPDPEGFLLTLQKLNEDGHQDIKDHECVVIEDSRWGLEAAIAAEMQVVAVTNTYEADQLGNANKVVASLGELSIDDLQQICD